MLVEDVYPSAKQPENEIVDTEAGSRKREEQYLKCKFMDLSLTQKKGSVAIQR